MRIRLFHRCPDCGKIIYLGVYDLAEYNCVSCGATLHVVPRGNRFASMKALFNVCMVFLLLLLLLFVPVLTPLGRIFPWLNAPVPFWGVIAMTVVSPAVFILSLSAIMSTFSVVEHREKIKMDDILAIAGAETGGRISLKPSRKFIARFALLSLVMIALTVVVYLSAKHLGTEVWITAIVCGALLMLPGRFIIRTMEADANGLQIKNLGLAARYIKFQDIGRSFIVMNAEKDFPAYLYIVGKDGNKKLAAIDLLSLKKDAAARLLTLPGLKLDPGLNFTGSGLEI